MRLGMCTYWKDQVESPKRLRLLGSGRQRRFNAEENRELGKLLQEEISEEIVVAVPDEYAAYVSPIGIVPKKNGWRKIWDGRVVNAEQVDIHFRMEGPETVMYLMRKGDWLTSIDLKSAFNHLVVNEGMRPFLCFRYAGQCYSYAAMPFGSKHAPRLFTEALGYAIRYIRQNWDVRIVVYMDDLLLMHQERDKLELYSLQIAAYLQCLGWTIATAKCSFAPSQEIDFLGWRWSSTALTLRMTPSMRSAMLQLVRNWIGHVTRSDVVSSKALAGLVGSLNFLRAQVPRASLYLRNMHSVLTSMVNSVGWTGSSSTSRRMLSELLFWSRSVRYNTPHCFAARVSQARLTTDASDAQWGGYLEIGGRLLNTFGSFYPSDRLTSSNQRETAAVLRGLLYFKPLLQTLRVNAMSIRSDNAVTVYNLQRQGAGIALLKMTRAIFSTLQSLDIRIRVSHIPGLENVTADALSRMDKTGDFALKPEVYQRAIGMMQLKPTIDLFAHARNAKCTRFVALPGPLGVGASYLDAFEMGTWRDLGLPYLFPPIALIGRVLQRVQEEGVEAVMVVPRWPSQPWWSLVRAMTWKNLELGKEKDVLVPGPLMSSGPTKKELPPGLYVMLWLNPDPLRSTVRG